MEAVKFTGTLCNINVPGGTPMGNAHGDGLGAALVPPCPA